MASKDTLMKLLPEYFSSVQEFEAIMTAYGYEFDKLSAEALQVYLNYFIQTCDLATIRMWEKRFNITVRYGDTEDFRRQRLIQKFNQIIPYTYWDLEDRLTQLYGEDYTLSQDPVNLTLTVNVTSDRYGAIDLLYDLLWDMVPAHLQIRANQQVTNYVVSDIFVGSVTSNSFVQTIGQGA